MINCVPKKLSFDQLGSNLMDREPSKNFHNGFATDLPSEDFNICRASSAALTQVPILAYIKFQVPSRYQPTLPYLVLQYETVWDKEKSDSFVVTITGNGILNGQVGGDGHYQIKFPSTIIDQIGNKQVLNLIGAMGNADENNGLIHNGNYITLNKINQNTFVIYIFPDDVSIEQFDVWFF